jgi:hypothetical protein
MILDESWMIMMSQNEAKECWFSTLMLVILQDQHLIGWCMDECHPVASCLPDEACVLFLMRIDVLLLVAGIRIRCVNILYLVPLTRQSHGIP